MVDPLDGRSVGVLVGKGLITIDGLVTPTVRRGINVGPGVTGAVVCADLVDGVTRVRRVTGVGAVITAPGDAVVARYVSSSLVTYGLEASRDSV